jgi:nucleoside diphosphate kinase
MSLNLSYVLLTPYTISKSRTGGVLSRLLSRVDLELVGAQIFAADQDFADKYSIILRERVPKNQLVLLADYVKQYLGPSGNRPHRSLLLLFRGENPCEKLLNVCGHFYARNVPKDALQGETVRDTYSDLIFDENNPEEARYFEPAVLTPRNQEEADIDLRVFADFLEGKENLVQNVVYPDSAKIERTLVIIKPENWKPNSPKPGAIIDMISRTGLRIIGTKIHCLSLAQTKEFYGPNESILKEKLSREYGTRAKEILEKTFEFTLSNNFSEMFISQFGDEYATDQFYKIVEFMCGIRPNEQTEEEQERPGNVKCMILVYEGEDAVKKIRDVLGPTDPRKAPCGTIRGEYGTNIMINCAHASDAPASYEREKEVVKINSNSLVSIVRKHIG